MSEQAYPERLTEDQLQAAREAGSCGRSECDECGPCHLVALPGAQPGQADFVLYCGYCGLFYTT